MKEMNVAIIISIILFAIGVGVYYFDGESWEFNFYRAELSIEGLSVEEKLFYEPDKSYHTFFRDFKDPAFAIAPPHPQYILVKEVECEAGIAYLQDYDGTCTFFEDGTEILNCLPYTESNEYGCTFGAEYGFFEGQNYWLSARYDLHPTSLFEIDGRNYIKFIVYSAGNHKRMGDNFVTSQEVVRKEVYYPDEDVIVYAPYEGETSMFNVNNLENFEFDSSQRILKFILLILPAFLFFGMWYIFGREKTHTDFPSQMSSYPQERKAWQIAAYFNPPFSTIDKDFISALLIEFYHKKIIDIKLKDEKQVMVKLNEPKKLDEVETKFYEILSYLQANAKDKNRDGKYFNLQKTSEQFMISFELKKRFNELKKEVKEEGKNYLSMNVFYLSFVIVVAAGLVVAYSFENLIVLIPWGVFIFVFLIALSSSALFTRFKGDFYREYQHWQAFKKWLAGSFAMKHEGSQAVKLWEHYLVYSTALGVSSKVIRELKARHLINENEYHLYIGVHYSATSFAVSSGAAGGGGVGGGGVGGGGGGGR